MRWLAREATSAETQRQLDELHVRIDSPQTLLRDLSGGQRQGVEIVAMITGLR